MTDIEYIKKYLPEEEYETAFKRLENGEPVQYIVGSTDFYGNGIIVNKNVLIPRFETEQLVEKTINYIKNIFSNKISIVDLGTGSGCIAITLAKELDADITAVDISIDALDVARKNIENNNVKIELLNGNMLEPLSKKYDCIISNPPYISKDEEIMDIVKNNEPHLALYADNNGLYYYEEILKKAKNYLNKKSLIAFEIGYKQGECIKEIALRYFKNSEIIIEQDLSGKDRFVFILNK